VVESVDAELSEPLQGPDIVFASAAGPCRGRRTALGSVTEPCCVLWAKCRA
jgi:hypothetical protein